MNDEKAQIRHQMHKLSAEWIRQGMPSLQAIEIVADRIDLWKRLNGVETIWSQRPEMLTATLDDGNGQGLSIIHRLAVMMGVQVNHLGLMKKSQDIIDACHAQRPDFLGLTVLRQDSDKDLYRVGHNLPSGTRLIAGGPVFQIDSALGQRCNVSYVAKNAGHFIDFLLKWSPAHATAI